MQSSDTVQETVSAILPTFNSRGSVVRAIGSVLAQHGPHLAEVVVVDDCSSDGTIDLVRTRFGADPRIKLLSMERNAGPGAARNRAIEAASGEWVAPIDADDAWVPDRLDRLRPLCSRADVVFDNLIAYDQALGEISGTMFPTMPRSMSIQEMAAAHAPGTRFDYGYLKPLIRRSFIARCGVAYPALRISEDLLFYLDLLAQRPRTRCTGEPGYIYTTAVGSLSHQRSAFSRTVPDDRLVGAELDALAERHVQRLDQAEIAAIRSRAEQLRRLAGITMLHEAWTRGRYLAVLRHSLIDPAARRHVLQKLAARLGWQVPSKGS